MSREEPHVFNVANYGPISDDSVANAAVLRKATRAAADTGGGVIVLPPGEFDLRPWIDGPLDVPDGVQLCGTVEREPTSE